MDLKLLLRYQISGSVFIGWFLLFHYSVHSADWADMAKQIMDVTTLLTFVASIPIGAIIHQFSVTIKNQVYGSSRGLLGEGCYPLLSDSPMVNPTNTILKGYKNNDTRDFTKYIDEKISKLNSFYYMRFDSGLLAPLLAFILFFFINYEHVKMFSLFFSVILVLIPTVQYLAYFYRNKSKYSLFIFIAIIGVFYYLINNKLYDNINSNVELSTQSAMVESNIHYVITNEYSFESSDSLFGESQIIEHSLRNTESLSLILKSDNLQKISIIESKEVILNNQCSIVNACKSYYGSIDEESQLHIAKAEITKIDTSLLNKILIACLIISFLLLSYIPRIIKELQEYFDLINNDTENNNNNDLKEEQLETIQEQVNNQNRIGEDISFVDLSSMVLNNINFTNSNLTNAIFNNTTIKDCNFTGVDLSRVDFSNAKIINCVFTDAKIINAKFIKTQIINSNFTNSILNLQINNAHNLQVKSSNFINTTFSDNNLKNHIRREFSNVFITVNQNNYQRNN